MKRIAVYAGSFDPPTFGHLDVIQRVQPIFDKLYLVIADNSRKHTLFDTAERLKLLHDASADLLPKGSFEVRVHRGLVVDFCKQNHAQVLIRGLRALSDFESEFQMATMNRRLDPSIETLHIMTDEKFFFVSSSLVKELAYHEAPLEELVPKNVLAALRVRVKS